MEEESTSCYCLMDSSTCHLLLDRPGSYALVGEPLTQAAGKRLRLSAFGSAESDGALYSLRVYCVDDTPHAFQVSRCRPNAALDPAHIPHPDLHTGPNADLDCDPNLGFERDETKLKSNYKYFK